MSDLEKPQSEKIEEVESSKTAPAKTPPGRSPKKGRRQPTARKSTAVVESSVSEKEVVTESTPAKEESSAASASESAPPRKKSRRSRGRGRKKTTGVESVSAKAAAESSESAKGRDDTDPEEKTRDRVSAKNAVDGEENSSEDKKKGGTGRKTGRRQAGKSGAGKSGASTSTSTASKSKVADKDSEEKLAQKLLINAEESEECRVALVENGRLEAFHVNSVIREQTRSNIYKGRITAIEPNLQAVFVDIGQKGKNGFLPFSEIHPEYYLHEASAGKHWKDLNIQDELKKGQEILVQVVKEATGTKGANMTTYLSLPGRFLVLMPGSDSAGISRKIEDEKQRSRLREIMSDFPIPEGIGYIIRTASDKITKTALSRELRFLVNLWKEIKSRGQEMQAPALIYKDQKIIAKFLRDHFTDSIKEIMVDSQDAYDQVNSFLELLPARQRKVKVKLHQGSRPILNHYDVEEQIEQIYQPTVKLPSGGSIVINPTEALVAIDVNSGRTSKDQNFNETIFLVNKEAARELARQLRLRDLGGLIVVDFIDMRNAKHIREVEKELKAAMKRDKAKISTSRISKFGLLQISRQKIAAPIQLGSYKVCEYCQGRGVVKSIESLALYYLRRIQTGVIQKKVKRVVCRFPIAVAGYLLNNKRGEILELEKQYDAEIVIEATTEMAAEDNSIEFLKNNE